MRRVQTNQDLLELKHALAARARAGWALFEGGERLAGLAPEALEIVARPGEVVLRAPDAGRIWRVVAWEERGAELRLQVRGAFGRDGATVRLTQDSGGPAAFGHDWFEEAVRLALATRFGADAVSLRRAGPRVMGTVRRARGRAAVAALAPGAEDQADDLVGAGLVARARLEARAGAGVELWLVSAAPATRALAERLAWLRPRAGVRLFDLGAGGLAETRPFDQGDLADGSPALWPRPELPRSELAERILALEPELLRRERRPGDAIDRITLRGLEVARLRGGRLPFASFGLGSRRERLDDASWERFRAFVSRTAYLRSSVTPDRLSLEYRAQPERWLASALRDRLDAIDPVLDPRFLYEQVPARRRESRDLIDMLAVTRAGRLAVIEIKAEEDRALPIQGLNYWSRVRWHRARGEIARRGYFRGVSLDPRPPLLFLVAPLFRLHASVRLSVEAFAPEVEAVVVGLNSDWRREPRALVRWTVERGRG